MLRPSGICCISIPRIPPYIIHPTYNTAHLYTTVTHVAPIGDAQPQLARHNRHPAFEKQAVDRFRSPSPAQQPPSHHLSRTHAPQHKSKSVVKSDSSRKLPIGCREYREKWQRAATLRRHDRGASGSSKRRQRTFRSPASPPQAIHPCSVFHDRLRNLTPFGIAIFLER